MIWRTHRIAWILFPLAYWVLTGNLEEMWLVVFILAPFLWQLPDYDMNEKNTTVAWIIERFKNQWFIEQSLRIFFKWISWWEHRWITHSLLFTIAFWLLISPVLLFWWTIHTMIWLMLALMSHQFIDMFNNTWVRLFWPHPWKVNFLNLIPNLIKLWKWNRVSDEWFRFHWLLKLFWIALTSVWMYFSLNYFASTDILMHKVWMAIALIIEFYLLIKFAFVITWSQDEEVLIYYPMVTSVIIMASTQYELIPWMFLRAWEWLSNHWLLAIICFGFIIFNSFNLFWNDIKKIFRTSQIWSTMLLIVCVISLFFPKNLVNSFKWVNQESLKEQFSIENIKETYKKSLENTQWQVNSEILKSTK